MGEDRKIGKLSVKPSGTDLILAISAVLCPWNNLIYINTNTPFRMFIQDMFLGSFISIVNPLVGGEIWCKIKIFLPIFLQLFLKACFSVSSSKEPNAVGLRESRITRSYRDRTLRANTTKRRHINFVLAQWYVLIIRMGFERSHWADLFCGSS